MALDLARFELSREGDRVFDVRTGRVGDRLTVRHAHLGIAATDAGRVVHLRSSQLVAVRARLGVAQVEVPAGDAPDRADLLDAAVCLREARRRWVLRRQTWPEPSSATLEAACR